ncbi:unnamed protein product [Larinioides sclopetarius]|uniref:Uncharacterized protein n=1 Tax=Larinioides sclopetarius TaxID=280406 RepID=A0AAV2B7A9_9ARAC
MFDLPPQLPRKCFRSHLRMNLLIGKNAFNFF